MLRKIILSFLLLACSFVVLGCSSSSDKSTWYEDVDGDGYTTGVTLFGITQPTGFVLEADLVNTTALDCDDGEADINPGATEIWYDGVDQDCGADSDNDQDGDGYDSAAYGGTDCNDTDAYINPGATEVCGDSIDNDCTGGDSVCIVITSISELDTIDTGDAADLAVDGDYLYYIGWGNTIDSFGIIDFSDPTTPTILSTMDVGEAYGVAFDGRYAYVETDGGGDGLFASRTVGVIDCLDPDTPVGVDENNLGSVSAYDMELSGNYLFNFSNSIIGVYDVSTPTAIAHVANLPSSSAWFGRAVGNYLYYGSTTGLAIFDISDPATLTGTTTPVGTLPITGAGAGAAASGTTAFIAANDGGTYYIHSVDVSDPTTPVLIGSVETTSFIEFEMRVLGDYLLAVGAAEFVVIDISDPTAMTVVDSVPLTSYGWGFDISGNYAIVADDSLFRIIQLY